MERSLPRRIIRRVKHIGSGQVHATLAIRERITRVWRVLQSDYPGMIFDVGLESRFVSQPFPKVTQLADEGDLTYLDIGGVGVYWPQQYSTSGLAWVYREVFDPYPVNPHAYEHGNVRLHPGTWVVDAGASEGFFVQYALARGCNVLAIEPLEALVHALSRTFHAEIQAGRVRVIHGALGKNPGFQWLHVPQADATCSHVIKAQDDGAEQIAVYTLDDLIEQQMISKLGFVKMDIEGSELDAVSGAQAVIKNHCPKLSIAVYHEVENARRLKDLIHQIQPRYKVAYRGVWLRESSPPRPYMLMALA